MKETKITCPKCGTELKIAESEPVTVNIIIGEDSGTNTVDSKETESPLTKAQKRMRALKAAGIDTSGLFAMQTGDIARLTDGVVSIVLEDDPIFNSIMDNGTIPNHRLFRRWVMAQMFHLLSRPNGFTSALRAKGYDYQWKVIADELKTQVKLYTNDRENFENRNRWFNKNLVVGMCKGYMKQLTEYIDRLPVKKCKSIPYKTIHGKNIFLDDFHHKVFGPINYAIYLIQSAVTPEELYDSFKKFQKVYVKISRGADMETCFIDAYKGAGAYYTMKNMILFHGCVFKKKYRGKLVDIPKGISLNYLEEKAAEYGNKEGWRLFGVMKLLISDNDIDIKKKMLEWRNNK